MRLATIRTGNGHACVRVDDDQAVEIGHADVGALLADPDWRSVASSADGARHDVDTLDYATLIPNPEKVICVGLNYLDHIAETGRERPSHPTLFPKFARSLTGAYDDVPLPRDDESTSADWEAELGVVIGSPVRRASADEAAAAIAGWTVVNDLSIRDYQRHTTQFMPGKAWEGSTPVGPHLLVAEPGTTADTPSFPISCIVDGVVMQQSNTRELCFGPIDLIEYASTFVTLVPGDLLVTGTPGGVGMARDPQVFLRRGQTLTTVIDGVGECRNRLV
ncbi:acylpyruvate hydrolase [Ilumatobacter fluminis]|uniref:Acylpyruvate hydrolase n=1 Tax=Ilumatobacter fluminis TaxID=467091 RepID=A0A4R7I0L3_9ACTN|nr:fumarylacetoacetate hydrolase family protein [Ilumatobacter fluminis]TDT17062.1 acylpyruvate hydrolase [Ilumatobacter fluminis]